MSAEWEQPLQTLDRTDRNEQKGRGSEGGVSGRDEARKAGGEPVGRSAEGDTGD